MSSSPNNGNFELSAVFDVQSNYLSDISNNALNNVTNSAQVAQYVYDLQNKLLETSQIYANANTSAGAVLSEQENVMSILSDEQTRLNEKQEIVDNALVLEERKDMFTNTQRLQYTAYTQMTIVVVIGLCIHIVLRLLSNNYSDTMSPGSNVMLTLLHLVNIISCAVIITYMYLNMRSRSELNYNRLNIPPPNPTNFIQPTQAPNFNNVLNSLGVCYGDGCCGENTMWDPNSGACVPVTAPASASATATAPAPAPAEGFATYNEIYNIGNDLLPCKLEYPYKDSATAQPNDNIKYMKSYK